MNSESALLRSLDPRTFDDHGAAVSFGEGATLSRADLLAAATAVADRIHGSQRVAVQAAAGLETVVAVTGALIAGVAVVPIPPDSGPLERQHIIADSKAEMILGEGPSDSSIPLIPIDIHARSTTSYPEPNATTTALVMYTSGTTGAPKGVVLSRAAIAADLDALAHVWNWSPEDTLVHGLPLFHVHGLILGVLGALRVGSPLIHTVRPTPESYAAAGGSLYFGVPTVWSRVCNEPSAAAALRSARLLVSGSAPLPVPLFERMKSLTGSAPVERYGMSETLITVSTTHDGRRRAGWVGHAVPGVRTRLRGENGELSVHNGEQLGQLEVTGAVLFDEYLGNPSKTAESMTGDGWFRTGDIAVIDESGFHRIVGRESVDMIKSGGYRIGAGEVEQALLAYPGVREAAVVGVPDDDLGQRIVAFIVGEVPDCAVVSDFVAESLSIHKRPRQVCLVDSLPRNAMGKVQKRLLTP